MRDYMKTFVTIKKSSHICRLFRKKNLEYKVNSTSHDVTTVVVCMLKG